MSYFPPRSADTTLKCPECEKNLKICRACQHVYMHCPACGRQYPLKEFIGKADEAMEAFLEKVYVDRI